MARAEACVLRRSGQRPRPPEQAAPLIGLPLVPWTVRPDRRARPYFPRTPRTSWWRDSAPASCSPLSISREPLQLQAEPKRALELKIADTVALSCTATKLNGPTCYDTTRHGWRRVRCWTHAAGRQRTDNWWDYANLLNKPFRASPLTSELCDPCRSKYLPSYVHGSFVACT